MKKIIISVSALSILAFSLSKADDSERQRQIEEFQEKLSLKRSQYEELAGALSRNRWLFPISLS